MIHAWAEDDNGMMVPLTGELIEPGVIELKVWDPEKETNDGA